MGDMRSPVDIPAAREQAERALWEWVGYNRSADLCAVARETVPALLDELEQTKGALQLAMSTLTNALNAAYESAGIPDHVDDFDYLIDRIATLAAAEDRARKAVQRVEAWATALAERPAASVLDIAVNEVGREALSRLRGSDA